MENTSSNQPSGFIKSNLSSSNNTKTLFKSLIILALILGLLIPIAFISNLIDERAERQEDVKTEVTSKWGGMQQISTPLLELPIEYIDKTEDGKTYTYYKKLYIAPTQANWDIDLAHETKQRSLFNVQIYRASNQLKFNFKDVKFDELEIDMNAIVWKDARLILGVKDPTSIGETVVLNEGSSIKSFVPFNDGNSILKKGLVIRGLSPSILQDNLQLAFKINGAEQFQIIPLANNNLVRIKSNYQHPSFSGRALPIQQSINSNGFDAQWQTAGNLRGTAQMWMSDQPDFEGAAFGVYFKELNNNYTQTERVLKYAILFLALSFGVFFLIETLYKLHMHPMQYIMVGLALVVFYTLLLAFSEHMRFVGAYGLSALATVSIITLYVTSIFRKRNIGWGFGLGLLGLYSYVYFLIQMEEMALLFGSIALFIVVSLIMYFTRNINKKNALS